MQRTCLPMFTIYIFVFDSGTGFKRTGRAYSAYKVFTADVIVYLTYTCFIKLYNICVYSCVTETIGCCIPAQRVITIS